MRNILSIMVFTLLICSCEHFADQQHGIRIRNYSKQKISVYGEYILPDTVLTSQSPNLRDIGIDRSNFIYDSDIGDPKLGKFKSEKLTIFIFSTDTLSKYTWSEIKEDYKVLKRFELNQQDLIDMGGVVNYP